MSAEKVGANLAVFVLVRQATVHALAVLVGFSYIYRQSELCLLFQLLIFLVLLLWETTKPCQLAQIRCYLQCHQKLIQSSWKDSRLLGRKADWRCVLVVHLTDEGVVDVVKRGLAGNYAESKITGYGPERQDFGP